MVAERKGNGRAASEPPARAATGTPLPRSEHRGTARRQSSGVEKSERREAPGVEPPPVESFRDEFAADLDLDGGSATPRAYRRAEIPRTTRASARTSALEQSRGYYSMTPAQAEEVRIPPAPKLPDLDLDGVDAPGESDRPTLVEPTDVFELERIAYTESSIPPEATDASSRARELTTPPPSGRYDSSAPPQLDTEPPFRDEFTVRAAMRAEATIPAQRSKSATPAQKSGSSKTLQSRPAPSLFREDQPFEHESFPSVEPPSRPPRLYFSPHVRRQANEWAATGSLSLPGCSSPRHARALQRALLLALLTEPGWESIPQGLRQRAGWLFCDGWDSAPKESNPHREVDDLATVMGMPQSTASRNLLSQAVSAVLPSASRRPSGPAPRRHSSRPRPPRTSSIPASRSSSRPPRSK